MESPLKPLWDCLLRDERALQPAPKHVLALYRLEVRVAQTTRGQFFAPAWERAIHPTPQADALIAIGRAQLEGGQPTEARKTLARAAQIPEKQAGCCTVSQRPELAALQARAGDPGAARTTARNELETLLYCAHALESTPVRSQEFLRAARAVALEEKRPERALVALSQVAAGFTQAGNAWESERLARLALERGRPFCARATALESSVLTHALSELLRSSGRREARALIALCPESLQPILLKHYGITLATPSGNPSEARQVLLTCLPALQPAAKTRELAELAEALHRTGETTTARALFAQAQERLAELSGGGRRTAGDELARRASACGLFELAWGLEPLLPEGHSTFRKHWIVRDMIRLRDLPGAESRLQQLPDPTERVKLWLACAEEAHRRSASDENARYLARAESDAGTVLEALLSVRRGYRQRGDEAKAGALWRKAEALPGVSRLRLLEEATRERDVPLAVPPRSVSRRS